MFFTRNPNLKQNLLQGGLGLVRAGVSGFFLL